MASGGYQPNKQGKSEPKRRSNWQRSVSSDRDDSQSLNSLPSDIRINNWDLSDLRPTNLGGDSKRRKKSKGNPEREREQSLSVDSPPHDQRQHSPSSYPRTKLAPGSSNSERVSLENLKQHMTFSDMDDISTDGERNNERQASHAQRRRLHNASVNHASPRDSERRINRNNNMDYTNRDQQPDSNEVIARLMQIRDFMKQARSMLDSMERLGDRKKAEDIEKVRGLIRNLQEQEQGYRGLLQNTLAQRDDQEDGRDIAQVHGKPEIKVELKEESDDDISVDLEVKTENSWTSDNSQESRPRIESKLGIESEDDGNQGTAQYLDPLRGVTSAPSAFANANTSENATMSRSPDMDATMIPGGLQLPGMPIQESDEGARAPVAVDGETPSVQHQELLKILREKQQQLQALMGRQEELNLKRRETEKKLLQAQARDNKARAALSAVSQSRQYVEQRLASHQAQSLLEAMAATSAAQAAVTGSAASAALEAATWERQNAQQRRRRTKDSDDIDDDLDDLELEVDENDTEDKGAVGGSRVLKSNIVGYPESDDEDNSNVRELGASTFLPNDLQELKRQLNFLRNEFSQASEAPKNMSSNPLPSMEEGRQQLQNKLQELQNKRSGMDKLLQELQMVHSQPIEHLRNNDPTPSQVSGNPQNLRAGTANVAANRQKQQQQTAPLPPPPPPPPQALQHRSSSSSTNPSQINVPSSLSGVPANLQARLNDMAAPTASAVDNALASFAQLAADGSDQQQAGPGMDPNMVAEVQEKLRRLKEVRGQLDQLRNLVQYYQDQRDELDPLQTDIVGEEGSMAPAEDLRNTAERTIITRQSNQDESTSRTHVKEQPSSELQDFMPAKQGEHQGNSYQQQQSRQINDSGAMGGSSSLHNMVQLLNLAGTDQGAEHSDEDNASVSQSDSQWSHLGPWDDDPEIQEKVKKLKAAKEKLRQLQDLVAFVQQSPEAARDMPDNLADLANSTEEGEGVSQATQTDEPNASVSEGEVPPELHHRKQQRGDDTDGIDNTRAELERLRKERAMLLEIQNQLKQIQDQTEEVGRTGDENPPQRRERREAPSEDIGKSGQAPNAPVVTFASNDELYSKMRRQRILREELRSKKKELEAIMKKDRNKRQYSRNQDNQSDTVSLNTDTFGITASVDATMATWGGSTVDNLENITEDEDGGQEMNSREARDDVEEDDGYPSDGIVQVEEEEEENDTDNGTYTIEADARQRKNMRIGPMSGAGAVGIGARPKTARGRQTYPQPSYNEPRSKRSQRQSVSRSKKNKRDFKPRQENYRSAEDLIEEDESPKVEDSDWFQQIQERLSTLTSSVEILLRKSDNDSRQISVPINQENVPQASSMLSPIQEQMLQLQNQSMMLSFGQMVQSLARQQGDMNQLQQQMQNLQVQVQEVQEQSFNASLGNAGSHLFRSNLAPTPLNNSSYNLQASAANPLSISHQQMPSPFTQSALNNSTPAGFGGSFSPGLRSIQQQATGFGLSSSNLSAAGIDSGRPLAGAGYVGGLSVNTVSSSVNQPSHHLSSVSGFVFNPLSQSSLGHQQHLSSSSGHLNLNYNQHHSGSDGLGLGVRGSTGRDLNHLVNSLQTDDTLTTTQQTGVGSSNMFPMSSSFLSGQRGVEDGEDGVNDEHPLPRLGSHPNSKGYSKKNKRHGAKSKKSETDSYTGPTMSTARLENIDDGDNSTTGLPMWSVSLGLQGTGNRDNSTAAFDGNSSFSSIQSIRDQHSKIKGEQTSVKSADDGEEGNTLFDTLRDTIYTEVASLISQNESRPHFLLELFRDIRQVDSDVMRQRTLYALEDTLRSHKENNSSSIASWKKPLFNAQETANSEQTPSESVTSEDDDDLKVTRLQEEIMAQERSRLKRQIRGNDSMQSYPFDYVEIAENQSSLSTPTNGAEDAPFFQDALGETVIGFDSLRSPEPERNSSKGKAMKQGTSNTDRGSRSKARWGGGGFLASEQLFKDMQLSKSSGAAHNSSGNDEEDQNRQRRYWPGQTMVQGASSGAGASLLTQEPLSCEVASSSAMDQASESSMSDMPYPRIDMKQLDRQIKAIMLETIPVVKEHMEDVCSSQLLAYIKRLVLSLTGQVGSQEFARFFHRQLSSILEDTLQKYHGRKMRECGEDLLVEISDVLFNELAFFRLMQDLDDPNVSARGRPTQQSTEEDNKEDHSSQYSADSSSPSDEEDDEGDLDNSVSIPKLGVKPRKKTGAGQDKSNGAYQRGFHISEEDDQEELGRERDDEMACEMRVDDGEEKEDDEAEHSYKIELAPSETKPFTRIGSDEDDDEGDEEQSVEDPSETAVSREINNPSSDRQQQVQATSPTVGSALPATAVGMSARPEVEGGHGDGAEKQDKEKPVSTTLSTPPSKLGEDRLTNGDDEAARDGMTNVNGISSAVTTNNHLSQDDEDNDELTVDDLPDRLTVGPSIASTNNNSLDLRRRYEEEQHHNRGIESILATLEDVSELAGDATFIVGPEQFNS